jgi:hypothetical protein
MKLRILDNSVQLRLSRGEVDAIRRDGLITAHTTFPGGHVFTYRLESSPASVKPEAFYSAGELTVRVPEESVLGWASSEQVSISGEQSVKDDAALRILVEKDFAELEARADEGEADTHPRPRPRAEGD